MIKLHYCQRKEEICKAVAKKHKERNQFMKKTERKKYLRCIIAVGISALMLLCSITGVSAAEQTAEIGYLSGQAERAVDVRVKVDGSLYGGDVFLKNGATYVGLRQFANRLGADSVSWTDKTKTAKVTGAGLTLTVSHKAGYMEANGRYLWLGGGSIIKNGTMYVPIRAICKAFGYNVSWSGSDKVASAVKGSGIIESGSRYYNSEEVLWLSRIIHAEAMGETLSGKIAVGNVVLNRKASSQFPNTVYGVIFDKVGGVQFTPVANGAIYNTPNTDSIIAAKLCLDGCNLLPDALFFVNVKTAESSWVSDNREYITVIGNHSFFA